MIKDMNMPKFKEECSIVKKLEPSIADQFNSTVYQVIHDGELWYAKCRENVKLRNIQTEIAFAEFSRLLMPHYPETKIMSALKTVHVREKVNGKIQTVQVEKTSHFVFSKAVEPYLAYHHLTPSGVNNLDKRSVAATAINAMLCGENDLKTDNVGCNSAMQLLSIDFDQVFRVLLGDSMEYQIDRTDLLSPLTPQYYKAANWFGHVSLKVKSSHPDLALMKLQSAPDFQKCIFEYLYFLIAMPSIVRHRLFNRIITDKRGQKIANDLLDKRIVKLKSEAMEIPEFRKYLKVNAKNLNEDLMRHLSDMQISGDTALLEEKDKKTINYMLKQYSLRLRKEVDVYNQLEEYIDSLPDTFFLKALLSLNSKEKIRQIKKESDAKAMIAVAFMPEQLLKELTGKVVQSQESEQILMDILRYKCHFLMENMAISKDALGNFGEYSAAFGKSRNQALMKKALEKQQVWDYFVCHIDALIKELPRYYTTALANLGIDLSSQQLLYLEETAAKCIRSMYLKLSKRQVKEYQYITQLQNVLPKVKLTHEKLNEIRYLLLEPAFRKSMPFDVLRYYESVIKMCEGQQRQDIVYQKAFCFSLPFEKGESSKFEPVAFDRENLKIQTINASEFYEKPTGTVLFEPVNSSVVSKYSKAKRSLAKFKQVEYFTIWAKLEHAVVNDRIACVADGKVVEFLECDGRTAKEPIDIYMSKLPKGSRIQQMRNATWYSRAH